MIDPKPKLCPFCDCGTGRRGMDRCSKCGGTGSGFWAGGIFHANTKDGYEAAVAKLKANEAAEKRT